MKKQLKSSLFIMLFLYSLNPKCNLEIKMPLIHIISISILLIIVSLVIGKQTQGESELFELVYTVFFMANDLVSVLLAIVLIVPLPLLIYSIFKKRLLGGAIKNTII